MLSIFNKTASPTIITTHLSAHDSTIELARITESLLKGKYETEEYDSLHHAYTTLEEQEAPDSVLGARRRPFFLAAGAARPAPSSVFEESPVSPALAAA